MGSCERAVKGLESRAVSAREIKHFVIIFSKTRNNNTDQTANFEVNGFLMMRNEIL